MINFTAMLSLQSARPYLVWCLLLFTATAVTKAQNPPIWQMAHSSWRGHDGAPQAIDALAQAPDGFIWIAAAGRIFQFDGISFQEYRLPGGMPSGSYPDQMLVSTAGDLWFFRAHGAPFRLSDGRVDIPPTGDEALDDTTWTGSQDAEGRLFALQEDHRIVEFGADLSWHPTIRYPAVHGFLSDMSIGPGDVAWVVQDRVLYRLVPGTTEAQSTGVVVGVDTNLATLADGSLWVMSRWASTTELGSKLVSLQHVDASGKLLQPALQVPGIDRILAASDGSLWITAQNRGTWKIPASAPPSQALPQREHPVTLMEDANFTPSASGIPLETKDGSIWIGGATGLDSYRPAKLLPALPSMHSGFWTLCASPRTGVVVADDIHSLYRIHDGVAKRIPGYENSGLGGNLVCGSDGTVWLSTPRRIYEMSTDALKEVPSIHAGKGTQVLYVGISEQQHELLASTLIGIGLSKQLWLYRSGHWSRLVPNADLSGEYVSHLDEDGSIYMSWYDGSVFALQSGQLQRLHRAKGTDSRVLGFRRTSYGLLAYSRDGLFLIQGMNCSPLPFTEGASSKNITGIVETKAGDLWFVSDTGINYLSASNVRQVLKGKDAVLRPTRVTDGDYVGPDDLVVFRSSAYADASGRLWFSLLSGVVSLDPARVFSDAPLPRVFIRSVEAAHAAMSGEREFPPGTDGVTIRFLGLLLNDPRSVRYQYMLEGAEKSWHEETNSSEASYSHLAPGTYRFKVIASNGLGAWTMPVEGEPFRILPHVWETGWFKAGVLALALYSLWLGARWRLERTRMRVHLLAEERAEERASIARELHDTLLQGVQGLLLNFSVVRQRLQQGRDASALLDGSILQTEKLAVEARERIAAVRHETSGADSLRQKLRSLCNHLAEENGVEVLFEVAGTLRELLPSVSEELYFIAREALRNALVHAGARTIRLSLYYGPRLFRLECLDNGVGFRPSRVEGASEVRSRWGLQGMSERAVSIHAQLDITSEPGSGTRVHVKLDAKHAYRKANMS